MPIMTYVPHSRAMKPIEYVSRVWLKTFHIPPEITTRPEAIDYLNKAMMGSITPAIVDSCISYATQEVFAQVSQMSNLLLSDSVTTFLARTSVIAPSAATTESSPSVKFEIQHL